MRVTFWALFLRLAEHYAWTERSSSKVFDFSRIFSLIFSKFFFSPRTDVSSFSICTNLLHLAMYSSPDGAFFFSISNFAFFSITFCYFFKNNYFNFYMKKLREKKHFRFTFGLITDKLTASIPFSIFSRWLRSFWTFCMILNWEVTTFSHELFHATNLQKEFWN